MPARQDEPHRRGFPVAWSQAPRPMRQFAESQLKLVHGIPPAVWSVVLMQNPEHASDAIIVAVMITRLPRAFVHTDHQASLPRLGSVR